MLLCTPHVCLLSRITVKRDTYFKPVPGEIEDIIQAFADDRKAYPEQYEKWKYEVVLAIDEPSVSGGERPADDIPTIFELTNKPPHGTKV